MELAGRYAYAGRNYVCTKVSTILRGHITYEVHNHHNFAWKERHFDNDYWIIRKGSTSAFRSQTSFIGRSRADLSYIIEGKDSDISRISLFSTIHGAGRAMGRNEARKKIDRKTGKIITEGKVKKAEHDAWIKNFGVEVRGGGLDESPYAYKRITDVIGYHLETINILHTLKPIGVAMAAANEFDPFKD